MVMPSPKYYGLLFVCRVILVFWFWNARAIDFGMFEKNNLVLRDR
jgi:hypothetical protein